MTIARPGSPLQFALEMAARDVPSFEEVRDQNPSFFERWLKVWRDNGGEKAWKADYEVVKYLMHSGYHPTEVVAVIVKSTAFRFRLPDRREQHQMTAEQKVWSTVCSVLRSVKSVHDVAVQTMAWRDPQDVIEPWRKPLRWHLTEKRGPESTTKIARRCDLCGMFLDRGGGRAEILTYRKEDDFKPFLRAVHDEWCLAPVAR